MSKKVFLLNIVTIRINGIEHNLKGEENEEYLHKVAGYVDKKLKKIMATNSKLNTTSAAILTAINTADEMFKIEAECKDADKKFEESSNDIKELTEEIQSFKEQVKAIEEENNELKKKIRNISYNEIINDKDKEISSLKVQLQDLKDRISAIQKRPIKY